jgi:hypothetical protein
MTVLRLQSGRGDESRRDFEAGLIGAQPRCRYDAFLKIMFPGNMRSGWLRDTVVGVPDKPTRHWRPGRPEPANEMKNWFAVFGVIGERFWLSKGDSPRRSGYGRTKSRTIGKQKPADRPASARVKMEPRTSQTSPQWRCLILMFFDDFVELNYSDCNFLNLGPNPDTNLAFPGVRPEALTIPLKTANRKI